MVSLDDAQGGSSNPIFVPSSSGTPFTDAASSISSVGTMDLNRALQEMGPRSNEGRGSNAVASSSRSKPPPSRTASNSNRNGKRRAIDETLVAGIDFTTAKRRKPRVPQIDDDQSTLTGFLKNSPEAKKRARDEMRNGTSSRGGNGLHRNTSTTSTATTSTRPPSQHNPPSSSRGKLGGRSADDPILVSDDSLPRASHAAHKPVRSRRSESRGHSRQSSAQDRPVGPGRVRGKMADGSRTSREGRPQPIAVNDDDHSNDCGIITLDVSPPRFSGHRASLTVSPQKPFAKHTLVPETAPSPSRARVLVEETVPTRSRNACSTSVMNASQGSVALNSAMSPPPRSLLEELEAEHPPRRSSRARSALSATPEARQERQQRANRKALTPAPTPPLPSILEGLGKTPTPKKPLSKAPPPDFNSATKRRLFTAPNPDDESYRPNPGTAFARPIKPAQVAAFQASRPRRSLPEKGKYTLPDPDTPIEKWPSRPGTSHAPQTSKKGHGAEPRPWMQAAVEPRAASRSAVLPSTPKRPRSESRASHTPATADRKADYQVDPSTPARQRSRSVSSCLTPLPPTQLPVRSPHSSRASRSAAHAPSVIVEEPSLSDIEPEGSPSPLAAELPEPVCTVELSEPENNAAGADDDAGSNYELDMYADFEQYAGSPSAPSASVASLHNTPSKSTLKRPSLSPVALKALKSPSASLKIGQMRSASPRGSTGGPVSPRALGPPRSPSKLSQPRPSITARVLAEDEERQRKAIEAREAGKKAAEERAEERTAIARAQLELLEGIGSDSEEEPEGLDDILRNLDASDTASCDIRRSTRQRSSKNVEEESMPRMPKTKVNGQHAKLFKELERDRKRGMTSAQIEAALSASPERPTPPLDLAKASGVDEDVLAEVQRIQREAEQAAESEATYSVFWEDDMRLADTKALLPMTCVYDDPTVEMLEEVYDESTLAQLLSCLPVPKSTEAGLNEWLFELAFCASDEELAFVALERLLDCVSQSTEEPVKGPDALFWLMRAAWYQLGAKVTESERSLGRVARDRETASVFICRTASTAATNGWLGTHCAWLILCHLAVLAGDSSTSSTLLRQISATAADLFSLVLKDGRHDGMLAKELSSEPLVPQVRAVLALGQRNSATRAAVRWATTGLLLPTTTLDNTMSRPSAYWVVQGLNRIEDEINSVDPDFSRISNLLALWSAGMTDLDDGWANDSEARELVSDIVRVRDLVRENADDPATSEVKGRLQLYHHIVNLHVQAATHRGNSARMAGKGLEVGMRGQTRLSFGRESQQSGED